MDTAGGGKYRLTFTSKHIKRPAALEIIYSNENKYIYPTGITGLQAVQKLMRQGDF
jgi:hypothetical protein